MKEPPPLLLVIAGPARGRSLPLEGRVSIGRDETSGIVIPDVALSRRHCELEASGDGVVLRDLDSRNGSWVNGVPVTEHRLADGDRIRIGDSALVFVHRPSGTPAADIGAIVDVDDDLRQSATTATIRLEDTRYGRPRSSAGTDGSRAVRDLEALLQLSDAMQRTTSRGDLQRHLLTRVLETIPADAAAIVTSDSDGSNVTVAAVEHRLPLAIVIGRSLTSQALVDRLGVMANDIEPASAPGHGAPAGPPVRAAVCAPLPTSGESRYAICVLRAAGRPQFAERDVHLLAGIGAIGGLALDRLQQMEWLESENSRLRSDVAIEHQMIGESAALADVFQFVARAAPTEATVLIQGESGTGKELVAHAIHANSPRARGPFVVINCAALPEPLLESELFGHERGAFTGAVAQQRGRMELAHGGTLFLDEIGELAPALQAKLLRVLQDRVVERVGGRRSLPIDVRIVAATNRDLDAAIARGVFRQDLYYRLNVVSVTVPPLRERRQDIPLLAAYFAHKHAARCKRTVKGISPEARKILLRYDWPGNVRELENAIERAVVLGASDVVHAEDLPEALLEHSRVDGTDDGFHARVAAHKRALIQDAVRLAGGNVAAAARELGLQPTYLHRLIRHLDVRGVRSGSS